MLREQSQITDIEGNPMNSKVDDDRKKIEWWDPESFIVRGESLLFGTAPEALNLKHSLTLSMRD